MPAFAVILTVRFVLSEALAENRIAALPSPSVLITLGSTAAPVVLSTALICPPSVEKVTSILAKGALLVFSTVATTLRKSEPSDLTEYPAEPSCLVKDKETLLGLGRIDTLTVPDMPPAVAVITAVPMASLS